ncbi:MAG TPA: hypothetical protein EYN66_10580 [Myxococcales bacterium]|nr:hypothetical protein [Myxococcales bacterium]
MSCLLDDLATDVLDLGERVVDARNEGRVRLGRCDCAPLTTGASGALRVVAGSHAGVVSLLVSLVVPV